MYEVNEVGFSRRVKTKLEVLLRIIDGRIGYNKKYLLGRILTIIDGAIADEVQRKALKDQIKEEIWNEKGTMLDYLSLERLFKQYAENENVPFETFEDRQKQSEKQSEKQSVEIVNNPFEEIK